MSGTEIAVASSDIAQMDDVAAAVEVVKRLVGDRDAATLDAARIRAEALGLYERRQHNAEREHHYWTLRSIAEAGLGCLSFDEPAIIRGSGLRANCRTLACAFERGKLVEECAKMSAGQRGGTYALCQHLRESGYTYADGQLLGTDASIPWLTARRLAAKQGVSLTDIPPDRAQARRHREMSNERSRRMSRVYEAAVRLDRMRARDQVIAAAKEHGPHMAKAYSLLRQTLQKLTEAQSGMTRYERGSLDSIFYHLYAIEDEIGTLLRANLDIKPVSGTAKLRKETP